MDHKIFGITGWKNSGKTRMVANLVSELSSRGLSISTVKHAHHSFDIDHEGTDSFQHRKAGAKEVALVSRNRWAIMHELQGDNEPALSDILAKLAPCDLVIIEGYKHGEHPKIEMIRKDTIKDQPLWPDDKSIVAICTDMELSDCSLPLLEPNDAGKVADFVMEFMNLGSKKPRGKHAAE